MIVSELKMRNKPGWYCTAHKPTQWTLGELIGGDIARPLAQVERQANGSWDWRVFAGSLSLMWGNELGRVPAMEAAKDAMDKHSNQLIAAYNKNFAKPSHGRLFVKKARNLRGFSRKLRSILCAR